ncbi:retropepsin-like aspartic protease family protein [Methyloradius palustris]|uniref:retropepsin-like aspartic protease family protein n=1 Tax=Methyloradius palustris TaxID=2778876 RepID=UPI001C8B39F1|nr:TIGR02281 family clan AA aspartic protease [Methyloradius palustris]
MQFNVFLLLSTISTLGFADTSINVVGLFSSKAVVIINAGKPQTLSVGQTVQGVKLISADSAKAVFEVEGKQKELGMGQAASVGGNSPSAGNVTLYADSAGHYFADGYVNGASLRFLVDTGATAVALNSGDAAYAGLDYKRGKKELLETASGTVVGYNVVINTLKIGGLVLNQVNALVLEGGSPSVVLLGMTALNRMDMKRDATTMTLTKKY